MTAAWFLTERFGASGVVGRPITGEEAAGIRTSLFGEGRVGTMTRRADGGWTISSPKKGIVELIPVPEYRVSEFILGVNAGTVAVA